MEIYTTEPYVMVQLNPNTTYVSELYNQDSHEVTTEVVTTDAAGVAEIKFEDCHSTVKYDAWYQLSIYIDEVLPENLVYIDTISKVRPYVNATELMAYLGVTKEKAIEYEQVARFMINAIVGFTFDFKCKILEMIGDGTDVLRSYERIIKVHWINENNVRLWETGEPNPYEPIQNHYGIRRALTDQEENRLEFPVVWDTRYFTPIFTQHYDYAAYVDYGWPAIPEDIKLATKLLCNDIMCGNNKYSNKYIQSVNVGSAQRVQYFDEVIAATGNLIVDNILGRYINYSLRARVL